ncbi:MAG: ribonuclease HII [Candidatus Cloacimonadota bacterium]|nr:MAG: ribonuclease HII [Candidatus Cloacimonadota bacterium]
MSQKIDLFANDLLKIEEFGYVAGIDEAGRGPLAGPVVVSAVILNPKNKPDGLNDSKKLSEKKRNYFFDKIKESASAFSIAIISPEEIDRLNILQATLTGMTEAALKLEIIPNLCLIDGNKVPKDFPCKAEAVVKGDSKYASIAAASILAKVTRDNIMLKLHKEYPEYGFDRHKGYPTAEHLRIIREKGITPHHRKSFKPVGQLEINF